MKAAYSIEFLSISCPFRKWLQIKAGFRSKQTLDPWATSLRPDHRAGVHPRGSRPTMGSLLKGRLVQTPHRHGEPAAFSDRPEVGAKQVPRDLPTSRGTNEPESEFDLQSVSPISRPVAPHSVHPKIVGASREIQGGDPSRPSFAESCIAFEITGVGALTHLQVGHRPEGGRGGRQNNIHWTCSRIVEDIQHIRLPTPAGARSIVPMACGSTRSDRGVAMEGEGNGSSAVLPCRTRTTVRAAAITRAAPRAAIISSPAA